MENNQLNIVMKKSIQKIFFEELASNRMKEIQDLSKQINFYNLAYKSYGETAPKNLQLFKGHQVFNFYENIEEDYITLEKAEEKHKEFKSEINEIVKGSKKP